MNVLTIGKYQYNLDAVKKYSKGQFEKAYSKTNPKWEQHYEQIQAKKKPTNKD